MTVAASAAPIPNRAVNPNPLKRLGETSAFQRESRPRFSPLPPARGRLDGFRAKRKAGRPSRLRGTFETSSMQPDKFIETEGKIIAVLAGTMFRVELANQHQILAHISGKMRKRFIRLTNGDRVKLEMSPYDLDKGRIVYRLG